MHDDDKPVLVYSTFPSLTAAESAGRHLVQERLAACVNIVPGMISIYRWEGKIEQGAETVLIVKTRASHSEKVMAAIKGLHEFDNPALLVLPVLAGSDDYCRWLMDETALLD